MLVGTLVSSDGFALNDQQLTTKPESVSAPDIAWRYRLFETKNIWTFILLDTATGRTWQVHYSLDQTPTERLVINDFALVPDGIKHRNGRFTLYPTTNMYNFLLLDQEDSRIWQIQWSTDAKERGIMRHIPPQK